MTPALYADLVLVEDNPTDLELTLRVLERNGFGGRYVTLKDGAEALDYVFHTGRYAPPYRADAPKVIFLDLKLPKISGMDVLRRIKSDERMRLCPVVVFTSSQQDRDILEAYELGANGYVVKPIDFARFSRAISEMSRYWLLLNQSPSPALSV